MRVCGCARSLAAGAALLLALGTQWRRSSNPPATGQTAAAAGAAEGRRPRPAAARLPRRHQLRPRRRHHLGQDRQPGRRSAGVGLRRLRGRQAAEDRHLQADQARRRHRGRDQGAAEGNPQRLRRGIGGGARRRAAVRDFPRRLPRAPRHQHGGARTAGAVHRDAARAVRHGRRDVSARVDGIGPHDAQSLGGVARPAAVPRPQVRLRAEEPVRRAVRALSDRDGRADSQPGVAVGAEGADRPHGLAEGRPQVADPRQRGLHLHGAAADAQRRRAAAGPRQSATPFNPYRRCRTTSTRIARTGRPGLDMDSDLREIYDTANRNNVAIYAVDPRGLPGFEFDINEGIGLSDRLEVPELDDGLAAQRWRRTPTAAPSSTATTSPPA